MMASTINSEKWEALWKGVPASDEATARAYFKAVKHMEWPDHKNATGWMSWLPGLKFKDYGTTWQDVWKRRPVSSGGRPGGTTFIPATTPIAQAWDSMSTEGGIIDKAKTAIYWVGGALFAVAIVYAIVRAKSR